MSKMRKWKMWAVIRKEDSLNWPPKLYFYHPSAAQEAEDDERLTVVNVEVRELPKKKARR